MIASQASLLYTPPEESLRFLPEGPYPIDQDRFSWVAIQHGPNAKTGSVNVYDFRTGVNHTYALPGRPGFAFPTDRGNFVVGCERSLGIYSIADGSFQPFVTSVDSDVEGTIINDGVISEGNLIFGTKDLEFKTKKAGLYLWRRSDRKLIRLRNDQICSNGKVVRSLGGGVIELLDIDSPTRKVVAYRINVERGVIESERVALDLKDQVGVPDGMTSTLDGKGVIISLYNPDPAPYGRTIQVNLETQQVEREWQTEGSPQATCPQWVNRGGSVTLLVTTAVENMPSERRSAALNSGSLFAVGTDQLWADDILGSLTPTFQEL